MARSYFEKTARPPSGTETRWKEFACKAEPAEPTPDDLAVINREYALTPLTADQVYVRKVRLANDQYDRTDERFPRSYLQRFAETLPGKSLLGNHDSRSFPLGRFFHAEVRTAPSGPTWLQTKFYMARTPGNEETRQQIDAGVFSHTSIGYRYDDLTCDICGKSYFSYDCSHLSGREYDGKRCKLTYSGNLAQVEALEGSLVYLGAQYGAQTAKMLTAEKAAGRARKFPQAEGGAAELAADADHAEKGAHPFRRLPLAPRAREWDASAAEAGVRTWAGAEDAPNARYGRAFLWSGEPADQFGSYKLPYAAVIDGQLTAVPGGLFAAAQRLDQTDIPAGDRATVRGVLTRWYSRMAAEFDDDSIRPPWAEDEEKGAPPAGASFAGELETALAAVESCAKRAEEIATLRGQDHRAPFGAARLAQLTGLHEQIGKLLTHAPPPVPAASRLAVERELLIIEADLAAGF